MNSITQLAATFAFQSYFDSVLLSNAILTQTNGSPIVDSTRQYAQVPGIGVALHPASQSPVAIQFHGGSADSAVVHLTPGQKLNVGKFEQFEWGLPFGWLGGGAVLLYVLGGDEADIDFPQSNSPIIFHRQRVRIANAPVAAPSVPNWPMSFAWSNAARGTGGGNVTPQQAAPLFMITPDIVHLQFTGANVLGPIDLNMEIINPDGFDLQSPPDQAVGYSNGVHWWPVTFPAVLGPNVAQVVWLPQEVARLAGDNAVVVFVDPAGALGDTAFVDCVRYGKFM
jgi:hypothetical protein